MFACMCACEMEGAVHVLIFNSWCLPGKVERMIEDQFITLFHCWS